MPNILLWRLTAIAWKYAKTSTQTLAKKVLSLYDNAPNHTFFFIRDFFFTKSNTTDVSYPHIILFSVSPTEDKTERPTFWHSWVIEAESQTVLNTLTEHDFQDAFQKWQKRWEWCIRTDGPISKLMVVNRSKVSFNQMAAPVPEKTHFPRSYLIIYVF
jgi:hypothetical protein